MNLLVELNLNIFNLLSSFTAQVTILAAFFVAYLIFYVSLDSKESKPLKALKMLGKVSGIAAFWSLLSVELGGLVFNLGANIASSGIFSLFGNNTLILTLILEVTGALYVVSQIVERSHSLKLQAYAHLFLPILISGIFFGMSPKGFDFVSVPVGVYLLQTLILGSINIIKQENEVPAE